MAKLAGAKWGDNTPVDGLDIWDAVTKGSRSNRDEVPVNVDTCVGPTTGGWPCGKNKMANALISKDGYVGMPRMQVVGCEVHMHVHARARVCVCCTIFMCRRHANNK
jgi:hypothetical protein